MRILEKKNNEIVEVSNFPFSSKAMFLLLALQNEVPNMPITVKRPNGAYITLPLFCLDIHAKRTWDLNPPGVESGKKRT